MKIDRLLGITIYLLNRKVVTARELAERFEVSVRTVQRDMETLGLAGIPIVSLAGTKGGYEILDGFRMDKQAAGVEDYRFIITALKGLSSAYDDKRLNDTLEKVLAMQKDSASEQKLFLDFGVLKEDEKISNNLKMLEEAIDEKRMVEFDYTSADGRKILKRVEPLALTYKWYSWYLFGFCTYKEDYRIYKLVRMEKPEKLEVTISRNHGEVNELISEFFKEDKQEVCEVKLYCKGEARVLMLEYLGGEVEEELDNGDFILKIKVIEGERMWFSLLLGFGSKVRVLEPEGLAKRVKEHAEDIFEGYKNM